MQILPPRGNLSKEKTVPWWIILISVIAGLVLVAGVIFVFHKVSTNSLTILLYTHTNQFCVVQANIKPEALKVQTEHTRLNLITYLQILTCIIYSNHFFSVMSFQFIVNLTGLKQLLWQQKCNLVSYYLRPRETRRKCAIDQ